MYDPIGVRPAHALPDAAFFDELSECLSLSRVKVVGPAELGLGRRGVQGVLGERDRSCGPLTCYAAHMFAEHGMPALEEIARSANAPRYMSVLRVDFDGWFRGLRPLGPPS